MNTPPKIILTSTDLARLERLIEQARTRRFAGLDALEEELLRAEVVAPEAVPADVVTMGSTVRFTVSGSDESFRMKLVFPHEHDPDGGTISVLAPVGSALLGLREGDEIAWPGPGREMLNVRIAEVTPRLSAEA